MSERYSRLFLLPQNLYAEGSPVLICAGTLLKDNLTGKVLAQLKLQNLDAPIKGVTVTVQPLDTVGDPLGAAVQHQYLDLSVPTGVQFGEKQPFFLPNAAARSFTAAVTEVIFADNTVWTDAAGLWTPLAPPKPLSTALEDPALEVQYCLHFGSICRYMPATERGTWCCTCGQRHLTKTEVCSSCGKSAADLFALDLDSLQEELDARLEEEKEKRQQAEAAAAAKAEKTKKTLLIAAPIAAVVIAVLLIVSAVLKKAERTNAYNAAVTLSEEGRIEEAIAAFTALGDYEDSVERLEALEEELLLLQKHESAHDALRSKDYHKALQLFIELGDYKDSEEMVSECRYRSAEQLLAENTYVSVLLAKPIYEELAGYKDSADKASECGYRAAQLLLAGETGHEYLAAQAEAYELFCAIKDYKDSQEYIDAFSMRPIAKTFTHDGTENSHVFRYDTAGLISSIIQDGVTYSVTQEKYGSWYLCEIDNGREKETRIYYGHPYLPEKYLDVYIGDTGHFIRTAGWNPEYENGIVKAVTVQDRLYSYFTLYDDGNYSCLKEDLRTDFSSNIDGTLKTDSAGNIILLEESFKGTDDNGRSFSGSVTQSYRLDEHGNWIEHNYDYYENYRGDVIRDNVHETCDITYNEDGTIASFTVTNTKTGLRFTNTFTYALIYCPPEE